MDIVENDTVQEKHLERAILLYLDVPYFLNNPWYVSLWKRLYSRERDAAVLFLMRMKGVGALHSWIYLRLFEHFTEKGCRVCAQSVLDEGLKARAHPVEELEEKTEEIEADYAHALEKPAKIFLLGKEWVKNRKLAHSRERLMVGDRKEITFLEYRIFQYVTEKQKIIEEETEKGLNEVSILFGSLKDVHRPDTHPVHEEVKCLEGEEATENIPDAVDKPNQKRRRKEGAKESRGGVFGNPGAGDKLEIEGVLYIAKKVLGGSTLVATRIASLGDGNVTLNAKDYVLRHRENTEESRMEQGVQRELKESGLFIGPEVFSEYSDKIISLSPYLEMGSLKKAIFLMEIKQRCFSEVLGAHYLKETLHVGEALQKKGYTVSGCSLEDFVLIIESGKIRIRLSSCKNVRRGQFVLDSGLIPLLTRQIKIEHTRSLLTAPFAPQVWMEKIDAYLSQPREAAELQSLFIAQEVAIYEEE